MPANPDDHDHRNERLPRRGARSKLSLLHLFRTAHLEGASRADPIPEAGADAARVARRQGISEETLRSHLRHDLQVLLNTVNLDSVVPLDEVPHVRRSIVNYGLADLSDVSEAALATEVVVGCIRETLLAYEPRLLPGSLEVAVLSEADHTTRRIRLHIAGELLSDPVDFSLEVEAEIESGAGKLHLSRLSLRS